MYELYKKTDSELAYMPLPQNLYGNSYFATLRKANISYEHNWFLFASFFMLYMVNQQEGAPPIQHFNV